MNLHERVANALGWTVEQARQFSPAMLRELVRDKDPKLAYLISEGIRTGSFLFADEDEKCRDCGHSILKEHKRGPGGGDVCKHFGCGCNQDRSP